MEAAAPSKTIVVAAMPETKSWTKSLGVMAPLFGVLVAVAGIFGIAISPGDIDAIISAGVIALNIVTQALGVLGRATASKSVSAPGTKAS